MQGNNVQSGSVQRITVFPLGELRPRPSGVPAGRAWWTLEAVEEKATGEVWRHCGLLVESLEVGRCEQTSNLVKAEKRL
jgi:hypothetical protein